MNEMDNKTKNAIKSIQGLISGNIKGYTYNKNIVDIANEAGLTTHIPDKLKNWSDGDSNYDSDVYNLLIESYMNEDKKTIENFFQQIYDNIKHFQCCKRFKSNKCNFPKDNNWNDDVCVNCEKFLDNGLKGMFTRNFMILGYVVDDDGFIHYKGKGLDIDRFVADTVEGTSPEIIEELLPVDIISKGKDMSEVYLFIYCLENSLRLFLESVFIEKYGDSYIEKINIPKDIKNKVKSRKENEKSNKWLPIRGGNDLFYTDLGELARIIENNWLDLFANYFPNQNWITEKIKEISDIRNLIAHNSYIKEDERDLIRVYYKQIMKQIQTSKKEE